MLCRVYLALCVALAAMSGCSPASSERGAPRVDTRPRPRAQSVGAGSAPRPSAPAIPDAPTIPSPAPPKSAPRIAPSFPGGEHAVASDRGLVVAVEPTAAKVGASILARGGNAVDAAIATVFALAVTHSSAASLGGGGFALVRPAHGPTIAIDFRETAPQSLTLQRFKSMIAAGARGPDAVGVPGTVAGLARLHEGFGSLPFSELVLPAAALARSGYRLGPFQAKVLRASFAALASDAPALAIFGSAGKPKTQGSRVVQRDLAWTLERIASAGADDFYHGEVARRLARALSPNGPSLSDLAAYRALVREPLSIAYRAYTVETMPPPSAGGVALIGMLLMHTTAPPTLAPDSAEQLHFLLETARRAQAERRLGVRDPDSISKEARDAALARWRDLAFWLKVPIDPAHATPSERVRAPTAAPLAESEHTTHLSVVDRNGMVVSLTTTLSASFGAKIVARGTGMVMNNSVASFGSAGENLPVAGQRTVSSMAPSLLLSERDVLAVLGTPGGDTIPTTLAQIVVNLVDHGLPLDQAIDRARWHHGFVPDVARYEPKAQPSHGLLAALGARGHRLKPFRGAVGDANCIVLDGARAFGYADPREQGIVAVPEDSAQ